MLQKARLCFVINFVATFVTTQNQITKIRIIFTFGDPKSKYSIVQQFSEFSRELMFVKITKTVFTKHLAVTRILQVMGLKIGPGISLI